MISDANIFLIVNGVYFAIFAAYSLAVMALFTPMVQKKLLRAIIYGLLTLLIISGLGYVFGDSYLYLSFLFFLILQILIVKALLTLPINYNFLFCAVLILLMLAVNAGLVQFLGPISLWI